MLSKAKQTGKIWLNSSTANTKIWFLQYLVPRTLGCVQNLRRQSTRDLKTSVSPGNAHGCLACCKHDPPGSAPQQVLNICTFQKVLWSSGCSETAVKWSCESLSLHLYFPRFGGNVLKRNFRKEMRETHENHEKLSLFKFGVLESLYDKWHNLSDLISCGLQFNHLWITSLCLDIWGFLVFSGN